MEKRLKKLKLWLSGVLAFIGANVNFQFDPKELVNTLFSTKTWKDMAEEANSGIETGKGMLEAFGGENAKGMLEGFGVYEPAKAVMIDDITISLLSGQYKNGFAFNLSLPGITQFVNEKFLSA